MTMAVDVSRLLTANAEFGQRMDAVFSELVGNKVISDTLGASVGGMAQSWAAITNTIVTEIIMDLGTKDAVMKMQRDEITNARESFRK